METLRMECRAGEHIADAALRAVWLSAPDRPVSFTFNGVELLVAVGDTPDSVEGAYQRALDEQSRAYWTPERLAEKAVVEARRQRAYDAVVRRLAGTDLRRVEAAARWVVAFEAAAGWVSVNRWATGYVLAELQRAGYSPREYLIRPGETPESWARRFGRVRKLRWLVGQAVEGIIRHGFPPQQVHIFAEQFGIVRRAGGRT